MARKREAPAGQGEGSRDQFPAGRDEPSIEQPAALPAAILMGRYAVSARLAPLLAAAAFGCGNA